ncbi:MAG TPA: TetR/AcrR family transcriptional regulator [Acidobacteriaceae bacterium]|jgi:AcrR family transcriptional regulator|nr:TetR/AcrR family transcriptional regulator [Acidobacteriaceae bacterium]
MRKGDLTRLRIIALAAPIFNRRGFEGCSMQDIMDATGLEKGGLYRHFSSKQELAAEVFLYSLDQAIKTRTDGLDHIAGALPKLAWVIRRFVQGPGPVPGGCPLLNTAVDADDGNPILRKLARKAFTDWKRRLAAIVVQGVKDGEIRRGTNPNQLANTIIAALEGGLVLSRIHGSREPLRNVQSSLDVLLDSVAAPMRP